MTDFSIIQNNSQRFTPEDVIRLHTASREWLAATLAEPFDGRTVVVTHHAPSSQSVHQRYASDLLTPAFASNLESLMDGDGVALWIHGHMHESYDYEAYGTRVVCNPRGYAPNALNPDFRPDWLIVI
jgi:Icc-related predicted phosphoesterase